MPKHTIHVYDVPSHPDSDAVAIWELSLPRNAIDKNLFIERGYRALIQRLRHRPRAKSFAFFATASPQLAICDTILNPNRSDSFGFVNSAIVDCPFVFLALIIDLDKAPIPLNLIVIIVRVALDRSNNHGVDANDGRLMRTSSCRKSLGSSRKGDSLHQSGALSLRPPET